MVNPTGARSLVFVLNGNFFSFFSFFSLGRYFFFFFFFLGLPFRHSFNLPVSSFVVHSLGPCFLLSFSSLRFSFFLHSPSTPTQYTATQNSTHRHKLAVCLISPSPKPHTSSPFIRSYSHSAIAPFFVFISFHSTALPAWTF